MIHSLDGGGAERVMAGLASRLAGRGHAVSLITLDDGDRDRHRVEPAVRRVTLGVAGSDSAANRAASATGLRGGVRHAGRFCGRAVAAVGRLRAIRRAILAESPEVVLSFCDRMNVLTLAAMCLGLTTRGGVPVVVSERSDPVRQTLPGVMERLRRRLYRRAARVVALTEPAAEHLREIGCAGVEVIPSAVDVPPVTAELKPRAESLRIVGVGRLEPEKGFDRLIVAFGRMAADFPEWSLRIVGEGSERESLRRLAERVMADRRVSMPGWKRPTWDELAAATMFVLPSRYEGFPSALLEAMAAGLPCVATDCDGARAIVRDGVDGLLVPGTVEGIATGIRQMIEDAEGRERMGQAARGVIERFGWDAMVTSYERLLEEAARGGGSPRSPMG